MFRVELLLSNRYKCGSSLTLKKKKIQEITVFNSSIEESDIVVNNICHHYVQNQFHLFIEKLYKSCNASSCQMDVI